MNLPHRNFASSRDTLNLARSLDWRIDCIILTDKNGWPVVKAGRRDESARRALASSRPYAPSGLLVASISSRLVSCDVENYCPLFFCRRKALQKAACARAWRREKAKRRGECGP